MWPLRAAFEGAVLRAQADVALLAAGTLQDGRPRHEIVRAKSGLAGWQAGWPTLAVSQSGACIALPAFRSTPRYEACY